MSDIIFDRATASTAMPAQKFQRKMMSDTFLRHAEKSEKAA
jgi:hypothetical protein